MNLFLSCLFVLSSCFSCLQESRSDNSNSKSQIARDECSIFEAPLANALAWKKGDVLVKERYIFDNVKTAPDGSSSGAIIEELRYTRTIFDYEKNDFASFVKSQLEVTDFDHMVDGKPKSESKTYWFGGISSRSNEKFFLIDAKSAVPTSGVLDKERKIATLLSQIGVRDYRGYWLHQGLGPDTLETMSGEVSDMKTGQAFSHARQSDNGLELRLAYKPGYSNDQQVVKAVVEDFRFDLTSKMPTSYFNYEQTKNKETHKLVRLQMDWKAIQEVYVPNSTFLEKVDFHMINQKRQHGLARREMQFHWFSLNEKLDDQFFDGTRLQDADTFLKNVIPAQCGADSLIDKNESSKEKQPQRDPTTLKKPGK